MPVRTFSITALIFSLSLVGCGGDESSPVDTSESGQMATDAARTREPEDKMFAREQQLIKDAKGVQALLDKDADRKKDAVKNMNQGAF